MRRSAVSRHRVRGMAIAAALALSCGLRSGEKSFADAQALTGGDPRAGREKAREHGCGSLPHHPRRRGRGLGGGAAARRDRGADVHRRRPHQHAGHLVRWIQDPPAVDSSTAMPNLGLTERDARDIAAYLYALP